MISRQCSKFTFKTSICNIFFRIFCRSPSWPTPRISSLDLISSIPVTSPPLLSLTPVSTRTNRVRLWSFHSSPLRLRKPPPISPQFQHQSPSLQLQTPTHQQNQSTHQSQPLNASKGMMTPTNLPLSKCPSTNTFRFPPWSGPSPRAVSSPGLLPVTPDSPGPR